MMHEPRHRIKYLDCKDINGERMFFIGEPCRIIKSEGPTPKKSAYTDENRLKKIKKLVNLENLSPPGKIAKKSINEFVARF